MKLERTVELPNQKDIDVSLKIADEELSFTIRAKSKVDEDALNKLDERMREQDANPKRYAEIVELISVSKSLAGSYENKIQKEQNEKKPNQKKIDLLVEKRDRELETLRPLLLERETIGSIPYEVEDIYEERAKLFCVRGMPSLEKHATLLSWRETVYLIGSLLQEAETKK